MVLSEKVLEELITWAEVQGFKVHSDRRFVNIDLDLIDSYIYLHPEYESRFTLPKMYDTISETSVAKIFGCDRWFADKNRSHYCLSDDINTSQEIISMASDVLTLLNLPTYAASFKMACLNLGLYQDGEVFKYQGHTLSIFAGHSIFISGRGIHHLVHDFCQQYFSRGFFLRHIANGLWQKVGYERMFICPDKMEEAIQDLIKYIDLVEDISNLIGVLYNSPFCPEDCYVTGSNTLKLDRDGKVYSLRAHTHTQYLYCIDGVKDSTIYISKYIKDQRVDCERLLNETILRS